ncbi:hypothetical protein RRG08_018608 [Elysia crispata]|uniref:PH domain-containing protein n=1 Tax=Elysia crispata TaxID=231223 RepID=A0AAE1E9T3_9GAST|nr:hypothetical protein RRG08_018608 [Elysia crispata]
MSVGWALSDTAERHRNTMTRAVVVKAGWVFRQKCKLHTKSKWKRQWMVLYQDGCLVFKPDSGAKSHGRLWDLGKDCMYLWGEKHCQHLVPPAASTSTCLMELMFVGSKHLKLCALTESEAQHWLLVLERAKNEGDAYFNNTIARPITTSGLDPILEEKESTCNLCCFGSWSKHNKVREIDYRPATQGGRRLSSRRHLRRRVSWNDNITMIS